MPQRQDLFECICRGVARLGSAASQTLDFVSGCRTAEGGFAGRSGQVDLYYTVFGLASTQALGGVVDVAGLGRYLESFRGGRSLDFLHRCCLARCLASLPGGVSSSGRAELVGLIRSHRGQDGGFLPEPGRDERGTVMGAFFGAGALEDLGETMDDPSGLVRSVRACRCVGGGYGNDPALPVPTVPTTAAAIAVLESLGERVDEESLDWLAGRQAGDGGLRAAEVVPLSDLLSTAVGFYTLRRQDWPLKDRQAEAAGQFVASLRDEQGGYAGSEADPVPDCEYVYYALLAMGSLEADGGA